MYLHQMYNLYREHSIDHSIESIYKTSDTTLLNGHCLTIDT